MAPGVEVAVELVVAVVGLFAVAAAERYDGRGGELDVSISSSASNGEYMAEHVRYALARDTIELDTMRCRVYDCSSIVLLDQDR